MRRQAATITARSLHTRLPVPFADDEIAALADTMNTMLDRIETASDAQRRFVADASHELRSPLATIHANADLLVAAGLPAAEAGPAARIHTESRRMAKLVDDLLLLARVDDQALRLRRDEVDLDDLVYAQRDRVTLEHPDLLVEGRVEPVRVTGDPDQLHRVLRNLVDNAVRHARKTVTISLTAHDGTGEIVIGNEAPRSLVRTANGSSTGSCGSTTAAPGTTAAPDWASRSPATSSPPITAPSPPTR
jgi:signal transduction histidine kinase